jgi:hypothetical protein
MDEIAERRLRMLVEQYVETRKRRHDWVSIAKAEAAIMQAMPDCPITGRLLDDLVSQCAVSQGLTVHFDRISGENTYELIEHAARIDKAREAGVQV